MTTIPMEGQTKIFYQGVSAGAKVSEAHAELDIDHETRVKLYWFYVGLLAAGEYKLGEKQEDIGVFVQGASLRVPTERETHDSLVEEEIKASLHVFKNQDGWFTQISGQLSGPYISSDRAMSAIPYMIADME